MTVPPERERENGFKSLKVCGKKDNWRGVLTIAVFWVSLILFDKNK